MLHIFTLIAVAIILDVNASSFSLNDTVSLALHSILPQLSLLNALFCLRFACKLSARYVLAAPENTFAGVYTHICLI